MLASILSNESSTLTRPFPPDHPPDFRLVLDQPPDFPVFDQPLDFTIFDQPPDFRLFFVQGPPPSTCCYVFFSVFLFLVLAHASDAIAGTSSFHLLLFFFLFSFLS
jgi:hypothetical protein